MSTNKIYTVIRDLGGPFSTIVVGVLALALDQVSTTRYARLSNKVSGVESGMTKKLEESQDIALGAVLLLVEDHFLGDDRLVSHKIKHIIARQKRDGSNDSGASL